nr:putative ORF1 [Marmot picobirnavirus]
MTHNQIDYWDLQRKKQADTETARHYRFQDAENKRHNLATETYNMSDLAERSRHNVATEKETSRHNIASENFALSDLNERTRHNIATENVAISELAETRRHNQQAEALSAEQNRINALRQRADQLFNEAQTKINTINANANTRNAATQASRELSRVNEWKKEFDEQLKNNRVHRAAETLNTATRGVQTIMKGFDTALNVGGAILGGM